MTADSVTGHLEFDPGGAIATVFCSLTSTNRSESSDHAGSIAPIDLGDVAVVEGYVFDTGRTSVDATAEVRAENLETDEGRRTTRSFTLVALDGEAGALEICDGWTSGDGSRDRGGPGATLERSGVAQTDDD